MCRVRCPPLDRQKEYPETGATEQACRNIDIMSHLVLQGHELTADTVLSSSRATLSISLHTCIFLPPLPIHNRISILVIPSVVAHRSVLNRIATGPYPILDPLSFCCPISIHSKKILSQSQYPENVALYSYSHMSEPRSNLNARR